MGLIEKNDLSLDYDWSSTPGDDPVDKDNVGSNIFDRQSGEDVLTLLNDYAEKRATDDKEDVLRAEIVLRNELPKDLDTEDDVLDWLWSKMGSKQELV